MDGGVAWRSPTLVYEPLKAAIGGRSRGPGSWGPPNGGSQRLATYTGPATDSSIPSSRRTGIASILSKTTVLVKQGSARIDLPYKSCLAWSTGLRLAAGVIGLARFPRHIPHLLSAHMAVAGACG
jgi:hypothetical protein